MIEPREITEKFRLEKVLKSSRSGIVFRAIDPESGEKVAIKLVTPGAATADAKLQERFLHAMRTWQELAPPILPRLHDYGFTPDTSAFMVMSLLDGVMASAMGQVTPPRVLDLVGKLSHGLEQLAKQGVIHGNISPDNLLITTVEGHAVPVLLGFGTAAFWMPGEAGPGLAAEDADFAAPERFDPALAVTEHEWRADLYALAMVIANLLHATVGPMDAAAPSVDLPKDVRFTLKDAETLRVVLELCVRRDPNHRPTSYEVFRDALHVASTGEVDILAPPSTFAEPVVDHQDQAGPIAVQVVPPLRPVVPEERSLETRSPSAPAVTPPFEKAAVDPKFPPSTPATTTPDFSAQNASPSIFGPQAFAPPSPPQFTAPGMPSNPPLGGVPLERTVPITIPKHPAPTPPSPPRPSPTTEPPVAPISTVPPLGQFKPPTVAQPMPPSVFATPPSPAPTRPQIPQQPAPPPEAQTNPWMPPRPMAQPPTTPEGLRAAVALDDAVGTDHGATTSEQEAQAAPAPSTNAQAITRPHKIAQAKKRNWLWPTILGVGLLLFVGAGLTGLYLYQEGEAQAARIRRAAIPMPTPPKPTPTAPPQAPPPALGLLQSAQDALALGDWKKAQELLGEISPLDGQQLLPEEQIRLGTLREQTSRLRQGSLSQEIPRALSTGNLKLVRDILNTLTKDDLAVLSRNTDSAQALDEARRAINLQSLMQKAQRDGNSEETLAQASALVALVPRNRQAAEIRDKAANALEMEVENLIRTGQLDAASRRIEAIRRHWPDRPRLAQLLSRLRGEQDAEQRAASVFAAAAQAEKDRAPDRGLDLLRNSNLPPRFSDRIAEARTRLENQLKQIDGGSPTIEARKGVKLEFDKGKSALIVLRVTDDFRVKSVAVYVRTEGTTSYTTLTPRRSGNEEFTAEVPPNLHLNKMIEFYAVATDYSGHTGNLGSADKPSQVKKKWRLFG